MDRIEPACTALVDAIRPTGMSNHKELLRGASSVFVVKVIAAGAGFGLNVVVARILGASGAGAFYMGLTLVTLLSTLGRMGLDNLVVRSVASHHAAGEHADIRSVYGSALSRIALVSAALVVGVIIGAPLLKSLLFDHSTSPWALLPMAVAILPVALANLNGYALLGLKRAPEAILFMNLLTPLLGSLLCLGLATKWGVGGATVSYLMAAAACCSLSFFRWPYSRRLGQTYDRQPLADFWAAAPKFFWFTASQQAILWVPTLVLGYFGTQAEVGVYSAANRTAMVILFVLVATNSVVGPRFAELYRRGDLSGLKVTARNATFLMTAAAIPLGIAVEILAPKLMSIFGADYINGALVLRIMAIGLFINISVGPVGHVLLMCGGEAQMRRIYLVCAAITVFLSFVLIHRYGDVGAGFVTSGILALQSLIAAYVVSKKFAVTTVPR